MDNPEKTMVRPHTAPKPSVLGPKPKKPAKKPPPLPKKPPVGYREPLSVPKSLSEPAISNITSKTNNPPDTTNQSEEGKVIDCVQILNSNNVVDKSNTKINDQIAALDDLSSDKTNTQLEIKDEVLLDRDKNPSPEIVQNNLDTVKEHCIESDNSAVLENKESTKPVKKPRPRPKPKARTSIGGKGTKTPGQSDLSAAQQLSKSISCDTFLQDKTHKASDNISVNSAERISEIDNKDNLSNTNIPETDTNDKNAWKRRSNSYEEAVSSQQEDVTQNIISENSAKITAPKPAPRPKVRSSSFQSSLSNNSSDHQTSSFRSDSLTCESTSDDKGQCNSNDASVNALSPKSSNTVASPEKAINSKDSFDTVDGTANTQNKTNQIIPEIPKRPLSRPTRKAPPPPVKKPPKIQQSQSAQELSKVPQTSTDKTSVIPSSKSDHSGLASNDSKQDSGEFYDSNEYLKPDETHGVLREFPDKQNSGEYSYAALPEIEIPKKKKKNSRSSIGGQIYDALFTKKKSTSSESDRKSNRTSQFYYDIDDICIADSDRKDNLDVIIKSQDKAVIDDIDCPIPANNDTIETAEADIDSPIPVNDLENSVDDIDNPVPIPSSDVENTVVSKSEIDRQIPVNEDEPPLQPPPPIPDNILRAPPRAKKKKVPTATLR